MAAAAESVGQGPFGAGLLVSIPGGVLGALDLPGSIFGWRQLRDAVLPPELRLALDLVMREAAARRTRVRFVARPEIFPHGAARAWLDERIGDTRDHLALTDGESLKIIPGLANHVFFIGRGQTAAEAGFRRRVMLVPEAFASLASQVNGALSFRLGARWVRPPATLLRFARTPASAPMRQAPILLQHGQVEAAAGLAEEAMEQTAEAPPADWPLHFIPLSEAALADGLFVAALGGAVQRAMLGRGGELILLGLPRVEEEEKGEEAGIAAVLRALLGSGLSFPRQASWAVRLVTGAPDPAAMAGGRITLHPGTPFWRYGADLYAAAATVAVGGGGSLGAFHALVAAWAGRPVALDRAAPPPGRAGITPGAAL
jgi:hypothetical protein